MSDPVFKPDPVFEVGDVVECVYADGYHFKIGKQYTVLKYEPRYPDTNFTWPAYVTVTGDNGKEAICHARRFKKVENDEQP